tara:strand:+ start:1846 stop:3531 length:1686 start_codon:yes stop_codon:yes gene_type:complete
MKPRFFLIALYTLIIVGIFNSSYGRSKNFNYNAKNISSYFSALVSFDDYNYEKSKEFFKRIRDPKKNSSSHSSKHIQSLINLQNYTEAQRYSRGLENKKIYNFESKLILGLVELKKGNSFKAKVYFNQLNQSYEHRMVSDVLKISLKNWASIEKGGIPSIENMPDRYNNFKIIQNTLAHCFFDSPDTKKAFGDILENQKGNFSRYNFFFANYLLNKNKKLKGKEIIDSASKKYPRNLLINQLKKTLTENEKNNNRFNCQEKNHVVAEVFYVIANALSTQGNYELSNFYINLSKYLNPHFSSYDSLIAENFFILKKYEKSKKVYKKLSESGSVYKWYAHRQIAFILDKEKKEKESINWLTKSYSSIQPNVYQTFDFANFLRERKKYKKSIKLYSNILSKINKNHKLYPKVLDRRGMAYERINEWSLSEKDLLMSLKKSPNQPYVINYLAYSWVEREKNLHEALEMLREANELRKGDGYITDSLGWALYKLNRFEEAKKYLKIAITLMPSDPIVNDHFADCLWKNNQKIQARYYWNYVLKLEATEEKLKEIIENKLIFGLEKT